MEQRIRLRSRQQSPIHMVTTGHQLLLVVQTRAQVRNPQRRQEVGAHHLRLLQHLLQVHSDRPAERQRAGMATAACVDLGF